MTLRGLKDWFHNSLTIAWGRFLVVAGAAVEIASQASELLRAAGVDAYLPPKWLAPFTIICGLVTELARRRGLGLWPWASP